MFFDNANIIESLWGILGGIDTDHHNSVTNVESMDR